MNRQFWLVTLTIICISVLLYAQTQVLPGNGTVSTPALRFVGDQDTGFFFDSAGATGLATAIDGVARHFVGKSRSQTDNVAVDLVEVQVGTTSAGQFGAASIKLFYTVSVIDTVGNAVQVESGEYVASAYDKNGTRDCLTSGTDILENITTGTILVSVNCTLTTNGAKFYVSTDSSLNISSTLYWEMVVSTDKPVVLL